VRAAKAATTTIPIVFIIGGDPVKLGLVASLNRPGGNVTGVSGMSNELGPKRLGLLRELLPNAARIAALVNPSNPNAESDVDDLLAAGRSLGLTIDVVHVSNERDIDRFFATLVQRQVSAFILTPDGLLGTQIVALAADHAIPAMYTNRLSTDAGGLMSYGINHADLGRQVGVYTGQILKGAKPAYLPIVRPTKFELVINLKTAKTLGLTVPPTLLAIADEVIE
jgi:putative ABC transport system substrate-binding protein